MKGRLHTVLKQGAMTAVMAFLVIAPYQPLIAQAQTVFDTGTTPVQNLNNTGGVGDGPSVQTTAGQQTPTTVSNNAFSAGGGTTGVASPNQVSSQNGGVGTAAQNTNNTTSKDIFAGCKSFDVSLCITSIIYAFTVGIGSTFAYIAVYFFDVTVQLSLNGSAYGLDFISTSWTTARDLANMAFLFILLFIAFQIILRADTSGTMSLLAGVVVVALLVNFSFFFTRVVIDAGNILSIQFYNSIPAPSLAQSLNSGAVAGSAPTSISNGVNSAATALGAGTTKDLTAGIMNMLQIQSLLNQNSFTAAGGSTIATLFVFIAIAIVLWLLTVVFITAGVKFLFRVVVLWFLIIASPLAFIAAAVQGMSTGYFKQWRDLLFNHAFYPVAFLFIFLILNNFAITIGSSIGSVFSTLPTGDNATWGAIGAALVSIAVRLGFVIAVLFVGLKLSDKMSVMGAKYAEKAGSWAGGFYQNAFKYTGGYAAGALYRRTGGAAANAASNAITNSKWANRTGTIGGVLGYRLKKNITDPLTNVSLGTVASTYKERQAFLDTRRKEMDKNLENKLGTIKNRQDSKKLKEVDETWNVIDANEKKASEEVKETEKRHKELTDIGEIILPEETEALKEKKKVQSYWKDRANELRPQREQLIANMEKMDGPEIVALNGKDIEGIIKHISDKQLKAIKESLKFSNAEKAALDRKWHESSVKAPLGESKDQIKKLGEIHESLKKLGFDFAKVAKFDSHIKPPAGQMVAINLGEAKNMKKELKDELDKQENIRDNRELDDQAKHPDGKKQRSVAGQTVKKLNEAIKNIEKLEEKVKDIPKDVGDSDKEGEFKHVGK